MRGNLSVPFLAGLGVLGAIFVLVCLMYGQDGTEFLFLFSFLCMLAGMGVLFWQFLFSLTGARWADVGMDRMKGVAGGSLFAGGVVIFFLMIMRWGGLYSWQPVELPLTKAAYLAKSWIWIRFGLCLVALSVLYLVPDYLMKRSRKKMNSEEGRRLFRMLSALSFPLLLILLSVWGVDRVMARDVHWYSFLWPVQVIVMAALLGMACFPFIRENKEVNRNAGNCLLAFVLLHGYLLYSEGMIVWFGRLPEETAYFQERQAGACFFYLSVLLSLCIPLAGLLFRTVKNRELLMLLIRFSVTGGIVLELCWRVFPYFNNPLFTLSGVFLLCTCMLVLCGVCVLPGIKEKSFGEVSK